MSVWWRDHAGHHISVLSDPARAPSTTATNPDTGTLNTWRYLPVGFRA
ncbi:hypothetical protein [Pseudarthrobacter sp. N5]